MTELFSYSEIRGEDASGFWGTEIGDEGSIVYQKEPIKSSEFVKTKAWTDLQDIELNMLIAHARGASTGVGSPLDNVNNHPFVSTCRTIGLIHNGRIPEFEYRSLLKKYQVESTCDSELFLRIFEGSEHISDADVLDTLVPLQSKDLDEQTKKRLIGLKDIWSFSNHTQMAIAIGERLETNKRRLWMFRNEHRSLWLFDMRKELGQVFFCSTPEIWGESIQATKLHKIFKKIAINELPTEEIWSLEIDNENQVVIKDNINKYMVGSSQSKTECNFASTEWVPIVNKQKYPKVITFDEEPKLKLLPTTVLPPNGPRDNCFNLYRKQNFPLPIALDDTPVHYIESKYEDWPKTIGEINGVCDQIIESVKSLNNSLNLKNDEMTFWKLRSLLNSLIHVENDLENLNNTL